MLYKGGVWFAQRLPFLKRREDGMVGYWILLTVIIVLLVVVIRLVVKKFLVREVGR